MTRKQLLIAIPALLLLALVLPLQMLDLRFEESRRALVSLEMIIRNDYLVPTTNGWIYLNKPPLFNWLILAFAWIFDGMKEWVIRLPGILSFLAIALIQFRLGSRYLTREAGCLSALFFLTTGDLLFFETTISGEIDLFYALLAFVQLVCIFVGYQERRYWLLFLGSYLLMAAGILTKGLPSLLLQGLTFAGWAVWNRSWRWLFHPAHLVGIALAAGILGAYALLYSSRADLAVFIANMFMEASGKSGLESRWIDLILSPFTYPFLFVKFLLPWSLLLPFAIHKSFRETVRTQPLLSFSLVVILANILPYAITSSPKSRYIYMLFPFFLLIMAQALLTTGARMQKFRRALDQLFGLCMIILPLAITVFMFTDTGRSLISAFPVLAVAALAMLVTWIWFRRQPGERILYTLLFICQVRMVFNVVSFPLVARSEFNQMRQYAAQVNTVSQGETVYYHARPDTLKPGSFLSRLVHWSEPQPMPPYITYAIPYYYSLQTRKIMPYEPLMQAGRLYLAPADLVPPEESPLYTFHIDQLKTDYLLFRKK